MDIEQNKNRFIELLNSAVKREGIDKLIEWLKNSDFFTAPASTKYHDNYEGGLCQHSLNVYDMFCDHCIYKTQSIETATIITLLHDLCKVNFYKLDYRNTKDEKGQWVKRPYYTIDEKFCYGHGEKSVLIISQFIKLTTEESLAIRWHMGGFDDSVKGGNTSISSVYANYPIAMELHIADMRATYMKGDEV